MRSSNLNVRGLEYSIKEWGDVGSPQLFLLHGWMDCAATFGYLMPKIAERFHVIAPDLRGFGDSEHATNGYWFPDYFADLDFILDHYAPQGKVNLIGHSMGGNIVVMYAGIRPERVDRVLSLEAIGAFATEPKDAVSKYRQWMTEVSSPQEPRVYPHPNMLKSSIYKGNPQLPDHIIEDLADLHWGKPVGDSGAVTLKHDHKHRFANPVRYSLEDTQEIWKEVSAKVGLVMATDSYMYKGFGDAGRLDQFKETLRIAPEDYYEIQGCGHMLHLEQPERTAEIVLEFFK